MTAVRVGIDVGGTFTDLLAMSYDGTLVRLKTPTTPQAPEQGALAALAAFVSEIDALSDIALVAHASTIATNALLGQLGLELPRVAFITTAGFRDVLEIGRQNRSAIYDLHVRRPLPLARREDRLTVRERRDVDGSVYVALDMADVDAAIATIAERGITSVAIGFLHADIDDAHEALVAERIAARLPNVAVTRSAELVRQYREYERFSTAVVNAALLPVVQGYLDRFARGVRALGVTAPLFAMRSDGGMSSLEVAARRPAALLESGPASGVIAAAYLGRMLGLEAVLSFDMGGTTAKAGAVLGGRPEIASEFEAAGATHSGRAQKGSGYPVRFPFVDLAEISAGGGTLAALDTAGTLRVGPLSAGADPGPAAYGKGERPTVTDANIVLGRLNPRALLGGTFALDAARAERALASIAGDYGGAAVSAAGGVLALIDSEMAKVLRIVSVERGYDPRDFTLVAFGGGGPLHACAVAREIGVRSIVVPALPGLFSAYGLLAADVRVTTARSLVAPVTAEAWNDVERTFAQLASEGEAALAEQGIVPADRHFVREADMRYAGQSFELTLACGASYAHAVAAFHAKHERRYGFAAPDESVQIVTLRVIALGRTLKPPLDAAACAAPHAPPAHALIEQRAVWDGSALLDTRVFDRAQLTPGTQLAGPAVIEQYDTTTYVAPGWNGRADPFGNLALEDDAG